MVTTIRLINAFIKSYSYRFFVCAVGTFKTYSLSNFQVYNTVLLTQSPRCTLGPGNIHNWKFAPFEQLLLIFFTPQTLETTDLLSVS